MNITDMQKRNQLQAQLEYARAFQIASDIWKNELEERIERRLDPPFIATTSPFTDDGNLQNFQQREAIYTQFSVRHGTRFDSTGNDVILPAENFKDYVDPVKYVRAEVRRTRMQFITNVPGTEKKIEAKAFEMTDDEIIKYHKERQVRKLNERMGRV